MDFTLQKVSNFGAEQPIIARLSIQATLLTEAFFIPKAKRDAIYGIYALKIQPRLLKCFEIMTKIKSAYKGYQSIPENGYISNGVILCPAIIDLDSFVEGFLHEAKAILRETIQLLNIFYSTSYTDSRFDEAYKWASKKFGDPDMLTEFLRYHHDSWIMKIQQMRDSITHPYSTAIKILEVENITIRESLGHLEIIEPQWRWGNEQPRSIADDMKEYTNNLLIFSEELLVQLLRKTPPAVFIKIEEIPESYRKTKSPIRFYPSVQRLPNEAEMRIISDNENWGA